MSRTLTVNIVGDPSGLSRAFASASAASEGFGAKMSSVGGSISAVGASMTRNLTLPITAGFGAAIKMSQDFQDTLQQMIGLAGVSQKQVDVWSKQLLKLGPEVGKSPKELAEALYQVASSGVPVSKAMDVLTASAKASASGLGQTAQVADAVTSVMNAYGASNMTASDAVNTLIATVREGKGEAADFAPVIGNVVSVASQLGVSFNDVGAALASMTRLGTDAATSATQLQAFFSSLLKTTPAAAKSLASVGLNSADLRKELGSQGLLPTLQTIKGAFGDNTAEMAKAFPNIRALRALLGLVGSQAKGTADVFKSMKDNTGALGTAFGAAAADDGFKFRQALAQIEASAIELGDKLAPIAARVSDAMSKMLGAFDQLSTGRQNLILIGVAVVAALGPALSIIGSFITVIGGLSTALVFLAANPVVLLIAGLALFAGAIAAAVIWPDKFRAALERMGLSASTSGQIVATLQNIFDRVREATSAVEAVVRANWPQIQAIITGAVDIIRTTISDFVTVAEALWREFGDNIVSAARTAWSLVKATIQNGLEVIRGVIDLIDGIIHGNWSKAWQGLKEIVSGVLSQVVAEVHAGVSLLGDAAAAAGKALLVGLRAGGDAAVSLMKALPGKIVGALGDLGRLLVNAGADLIGGFIQGIESKLGAVKDTLTGLTSKLTSWKGPPEYDRTILTGSGQLVIQGFIDGLESRYKDVEKSLKNFGSGLAISADIMQAARTIGLSQAEQIAAGFVQGTPTLQQQIKQGLMQAVEQAKQAVVAARQSYSDAFSQLAQSALQAFDDKVAAWVPPAQKLLDKMQLQDQATQLKQQLEQAAATVSSDQTALSAAQASGDPAQIKAAQDQLLQDQTAYTAASRSLQEFDLQQKATKQEAAYQATEAKQRESLARQLLTLQTELAKDPGEYEKVGKQVVALLKKFDVPMFAAGQRIASQFADGLKSQLAEVEKAAAALAKAVTDHLVTHSPSKKGPLSVMSPFDIGARIGAAFNQGLGASLYGGQGLQVIAAASAGASGPSRSVPGVYIAPGAIQVNGFVGNEQELTRTIIDGINSASLGGPLLHPRVIAP